MLVKIDNKTVKLSINNAHILCNAFENKVRVLTKKRRRLNEDLHLHTVREGYAPSDFFPKHSYSFIIVVRVGRSLNVFENFFAIDDSFDL